MVKNRLREIRMKEYLMSQKEFAELLKVDDKTYSNWENNFSRPILEKALEIAKILNKKVEDIWFLD